MTEYGAVSLDGASPLPMQGSRDKGKKYYTSTTSKKLFGILIF